MAHLSGQEISHLKNSEGMKMNLYLKIKWFGFQTIMNTDIISNLKCSAAAVT